jgi:trimeric autotransporter adhesin
MKLTFTFLLLSLAVTGIAQSVGIGTTTPNGSAQLDISSSSRGILIPRMTTDAVSGIANPAKGLMIYDSTRNQLLVNMGTPAAPDWENIIANSGWGLSGNSVSANTAVIGTTSPFDLRFVVNNIPAGLVDSGLGNTFLGYGAVPAANPSALFNTGMGFMTLPNNQAEHNTADGFQALLANSMGYMNTAIGSVALTENINGFENCAMGYSALGFNTGGSANTGIGDASLQENRTGSFNTAVGGVALQNTTNSEYNTAVGYNAGRAFDNGYNNVFVGANTDVNGAGYFNVVSIGQGTVCTASSQARFGNTATNSIGGYANWTNFSDGRYKKNMKEDVIGLDFIMRLRPLTYNLDVTAIQAHLHSTAQQPPKPVVGVRGIRTQATATAAPRTADQHIQQAMAEREREVLSGFSAQEVENAAQSAGYTFSGVDRPKNGNDFYGLRYGDFVVPLVKAVQEQQQMIRDMQKQLNQQAELIKHLLPKK